MTTVTVSLKIGSVTRSAAVILRPSASWTSSWHRLGPLGVHMYRITRPGGAIECAIRISNGCVQPDGSGFPGRVFYDELAIGLDAGMMIRKPHPGDDGSVLAWKLASGGGHVFPPRAILERRFVILPPGVHDDANAILAFKHARFADPTDRWGPAREPQPKVDRARYAQQFAGVVAALGQAIAQGKAGRFYHNGTNGPAPAFDLRTAALGPFHPDGYSMGGAPAGYGIVPAFGYEQCDEHLEYSAMMHECVMARNPVACYDADTGEPITCLDWKSNGLAHPQLMKGEPEPQNMKLELPAFLQGNFSTYAYKNFNAGACAYKNALESYVCDDVEHLVRALRHAISLWGWVHDPMAGDDLRMLFEHHRTMTFGDRPDDKTHASYPGEYVPTSLSALAYHVNQNPGRGAPVLRSFGWIMLAGAWGGATRAWARNALDTCRKMLDKHGLPQREYHEPYMPEGVRGTQHFHSALIHLGALTLARYMGLESTLLDQIETWRREVLENPAMPLQERYDGPGSFGPPKWIWTQMPDGSEPALATERTSGGGFQEHVLSVLGKAALAAIEQGDASGARAFLTAGLRVGGSSPTLTLKLQQIRSIHGDISQHASYAAAIERLP